MNAPTRRLLAATFAAMLLAWPAAQARTQQNEARTDARVERGAPPPPPPTLTDTTPPHPADAIDRARDGLPQAIPAPPESDEPMVTPKVPPPVRGAATTSPSALPRGLDRDADGVISVNEGSADADFSAHFAVMDANADGFVSDSEYRAHVKAMHEPQRER